MKREIRKIIHQNNILKKWIVDNYGVPCEINLINCHICKAWVLYSQLVLQKQQLKRML